MKEHIPKHEDKCRTIKNPKTNHVHGHWQLTEYIEEDDSDGSEGEVAGHIDRIDQTAVEAHTVKFELA